MGCAAVPTITGLDWGFTGSAKPFRTSEIGLPTVSGALRATSKATGSAVSCVTIREPESPSALKPLFVMETGLVKETLKTLPVPHPFWYSTLMFACMEKMEEQVKPVDRPLFATVLPTVGATPEPARGGASSGGLLGVPLNLRIGPAGSTAPRLICASAASIFGAGPLSLV